MTPRYDQVTLDPGDSHNKLQKIVSPVSGDSSLWIHQNAFFFFGRFDKGFNTDYRIRSERNGVYAFIIKGEVTINRYKLEQRDGLGLSETKIISISSDSESEILLMEIPLVH